MQTQTLNIVLPKELVQKIDNIARQQYKNRSELIREAVRIYLYDASKWERVFQAGEKAAKKAGITSENQINDIMYELRHGKKKNSS